MNDQLTRLLRSLWSLAMTRRCFGLLTLFFLITSCSTITPPTHTTWTARQKQLSQYKQWALSGKIAVQSDRDAGSAALHWVEDGEQYHISLTGPLGTSALTIVGKPNQVSMETSDGKHLEATSAEALLKAAWGTTLPVKPLIYWIRGLPAPHLPTQLSFDTDHRLSRLSQADAHIEYLAYMNVQGIWLPQKISITLPGLRIKIVIHEWIFH